MNEMAQIEKHTGYHVSNWSWNGYTDVCGEWNSTGGGWFYVGRGERNGLLHNYNISVNGKKGHYSLYINQCLLSGSSNEIPVFALGYKRKMDLYSEIRSEIEAYDKSDQPDLMMAEWKKRSAKPVFVINKGELKLVGTHYSHSIYDDIYNTPYWHDDVPSRSGSGVYYTLAQWCGEYVFLERETHDGGCRISGGHDDRELLMRMLDMVRDDERYEWIVKIPMKEKVVNG